MQLFVIEGGIVKPNPETLLIYPFKEIWERDESIGKEVAMKEMAYIEFMSSPKRTNPFFGYDDDVKEMKVIENVFKEEGYSPDELVLEARKQYYEFFDTASPQLSYLMAARAGAEKMKDWLLNFDLSEKNERGALLYKPADITRALSDTFNVMKTLNAMQEKVEQEVYETLKTKSNRTINPFEE